MPMDGTGSSSLICNQDYVKSTLRLTVIIVASNAKPNGQVWKMMNYLHRTSNWKNQVVLFIVCFSVCKTGWWIVKDNLIPLVCIARFTCAFLEVVLKLLTWHLNGIQLVLVVISLSKEMTRDILDDEYVCRNYLFLFCRNDSNFRLHTIGLNNVLKVI